ncbi:uncharacterized protein LOC113866848 [Abrus precatorius]|uniref:Uncharacterized protein LOC113866848 n=1 Tax=Abrus precatorius TaxID=3816 RepID=A0A8B8LNG5_ABRPR|nr:uncharacterized protein LOC113866848 [Abrus precatorius]
MSDYARPSLTGTESNIVRPDVQENLEIKSNVIQMEQSKTVVELSPTRIYHFMGGYDRKILGKIFSSRESAKIRNDISSFYQLESETLYNTWERFKELLRKCPHHGIPDCFKCKPSTMMARPSRRPVSNPPPPDVNQMAHAIGAMFRPSQSKGATLSAPRPVGTATSALQPKGASTPSFRVSAPTIVRCFRCGGPHYLNQCQQADTRVYFLCRQSGHLAKDCPTSQIGAASSTASALHVVRPRAVRATQVTRPRAEARVFTTSGIEAAQAIDLVQGTGVVAGTPLSVLFDFRAMHSFIADVCLKNLGFPVSDLRCNLVVATSTLNSITTSTVCIGYPIVVEGQEYRVNLINIPMLSLDVILGMNWLTANHVVIDCAQGRLIFPEQ